MTAGLVSGHCSACNAPALRLPDRSSWWHTKGKPCAERVGPPFTADFVPGRAA